MKCSKCGKEMIETNHPYDGSIYYCDECKTIIEKEKQYNYLTFENCEVFNFNNAIRGMRNPLNSWDKSDSYLENGNFILGKADLDLCIRLIQGGTEHRKFLRQIMVSVDITGPRYWWAEFDTYKIGTVANSTSTMHKLASRPIVKEDFVIDNKGDVFWNMLIDHLELLRKNYNETKDIKWFRMLKQMLPESYKNKRTVTLNYETILTMLRQRNNHRLGEWKEDFTQWALSLPYMDKFYNATLNRREDKVKFV